MIYLKDTLIICQASSLRATRTLSLITSYNNREINKNMCYDRRKILRCCNLSISYVYRNTYFYLFQLIGLKTTILVTLFVPSPFSKTILEQLKYNRAICASGSGSPNLLAAQLAQKKTLNSTLPSQPTPTDETQLTETEAQSDLLF